MCLLGLQLGKGEWSDNGRTITCLPLPFTRMTLLDIAVGLERTHFLIQMSALSQAQLKASTNASSRHKYSQD